MNHLVQVDVIIELSYIHFEISGFFLFGFIGMRFNLDRIILKSSLDNFIKVLY